MTVGQSRGLLTTRRCSRHREVGTLARRPRSRNRHWARALVCVVLSFPVVSSAQSEVTTILWDHVARARVLRQVVGADFVFTSTAAIETPAGPALLAAVSAGDDRMRLLRIERRNAAWQMVFDSRLEPDEHNFMRVGWGWRDPPFPSSKQSDDLWYIEDANGDGRLDAIFGGCHREWCGGAFSFALFGAAEPTGWIIHVLLGRRREPPPKFPVEFWLSTPPPPRAYRDYLLQRLLDAPLARDQQSTLESWLRRLP